MSVSIYSKKKEEGGNTLYLLIWFLIFWSESEQSDQPTDT